MNHLIRGDDYLARVPNFKLVGREAELKQLSSILIRSKANSVLLVGPGGVGCTALCMGLQASKKIRTRRSTSSTSASSGSTPTGCSPRAMRPEINKLFQKIMNRLTARRNRS